MARDLDTIWKALSDPTRREILDLLRDGTCQTTDIVEQFPELSRFGVMKHLDVLGDTGLVKTRSEGRHRINSLNAVKLRQIAERWIGKYEAHWSDTQVRVKETAEKRTPTGRTKRTNRPGVHFCMCGMARQARNRDKSTVLRGCDEFFPFSRIKNPGAKYS